MEEVCGCRLMAGSEWLFEETEGEMSEVGKGARHTGCAGGGVAIPALDAQLRGMFRWNGDP